MVSIPFCLKNYDITKSDLDKEGRGKVIIWGRESCVVLCIKEVQTTCGNHGENQSSCSEAVILV